MPPYETFSAVVGDKGDRCNQRRNKICYKPSTGVGFYFLLWFSKSLVYFITFVSNRQSWYYGQGPPFWLLIGIIWGKKNTQMLRTYSSPIKSETLDVGSCEQQGFFKLPWWFQRSANLRTTNLEFKFEAVQKRKLLIPWRKLKCEMSLSNRWRVIRESTWLCFMEHSSASGPGLVTQDYNFLCTPKHTT